MADFLLELFSEEIPARMQAGARAELEQRFTKHLSDAGLAFGTVESFVTPRRLALAIADLPARTPDTREERKGPKVDAPDKAIEGFLRATGLTLDQCEQRDTPKGKVWFAVFDKPGRDTAELLAEAIDATLRGFAWPKSMVWAEGRFRWVRPLHHILAIFDGKPLAGAFEPDPHTRLIYGGMTHGHRFLAPGALAVHDLASYKAGLAKAKVILDRDERKRLIADGLAKAAKAEGLALRDDPGLLDEVAGLVEFPVVLTGRIDDAFMDVPDEVLITSMRTHQRYFPLMDSDGKLAPRFVVVANTETADGGKSVVAGNERVLRARLSDAKFFWDTDRAQSLRSRTPALKQVTFHERLGTMDEKTDRVQALATYLARQVGADIDRAASAARLAKADLVTGMVGEFPELQGIMGRYYALHDGEHADVANAIAEHYAPLGPNDACPTAPVSVAVALADKLDTLVGFWSIDEKPTGSRDPYALRRAALGVIRLVRENGLELNFDGVLAAAQQNYAIDDPALTTDLWDFIVQRLKVILRGEGTRHDLIDAALGAASDLKINLLLDRAQALSEFLATDDGANLLIAYRRAANIERIEAKKDKVDGFGSVDQDALQREEEKTLWAALNRARTAARDHLEARDFGAAMADLAGLRQPVDAFFDEVTVNAEDADLRRNRLALLAAITATMNQVADFGRIEG